MWDCSSPLSTYNQSACHFRYLILSFCFFFFQAEDGIRDHCVTGVQTCALPICLMSAHHPALKGRIVRAMPGLLDTHNSVPDCPPETWAVAAPKRACNKTQHGKAET